MNGSVVVLVVSIGVRRVVLIFITYSENGNVNSAMSIALFDGLILFTSTRDIILERPRPNSSDSYVLHKIAGMLSSSRKT